MRLFQMLFRMAIFRLVSAAWVRARARAPFWALETAVGGARARADPKPEKQWPHGIF